MQRLTGAVLPLGLCLAPAFASASPAPDATVTGSITVLEPMGVGHSAKLAVKATGRPTQGVRLAAATAGEYELTGQAGQVFSVEVTRDLRMADKLGHFVSSRLRPSQTVGRHSGRTAAGLAADHLRVGGDVAIAANATAGLYTGAFSVVVNYN